MQELSPVEKGTMGANADVQEALQQLQVAEEQLAKAQQDRDKAAKILTRAGVAETAGFQGHPHALNVGGFLQQIFGSTSLLPVHLKYLTVINGYVFCLYQMGDRP